MPKTFLQILLLLLFGAMSYGQGITTQGKEFYVSFYQNLAGDQIDTRLFLTSTVNTSGHIANPNTGYDIPFSITAGTVTQVSIPLEQAYTVNANTVGNTGLIITAADTISAYALNSEIFSSDATDLIQKGGLGTKYLIASYPSSFATISSCFLIEATEDNTIIQITPSVNQNNNPAGIPFNITLNKGQTYFVVTEKASDDLSGSLVSVTNGCKPIAVFAGNEGASVSGDVIYTVDHLYEQMFPIDAFGKNFITATLKGRNVYKARVYAAYNNTSITIDGVAVSSIDAGQFYEFQSPNEPRYISTSNPVQVMMFGTSNPYDIQYGPFNDGDPTMITIPPIEQGVIHSIFLSPVMGAISTHKVSITCKTADAPNTLVDGTNVGGTFTIVPGNPLYSYAAFDLAAGQHTIDNPNGFIAYAYGFGMTQGYGYCTGVGVQKINAYFTCDSISSIGEPTVDVCTGNVYFDIVAAAKNSAYTWNFGDGTAPVNTDGTVLQQIHNYDHAGNFVVTLTTKDISTGTCSTDNISRLTVHVVSALMPSLSIVSSPAAPFCNGTLANFVATPVNGGPTPAYQWKVNGVNVGTNSPLFSSNTLSEKDSVSCTMISSLSCAAQSMAAAYTIIQLSSQPAITIAASNNNVCAGNAINFNVSSTTNAGNTPLYQWKLNGNDVGNGGTNFSSGSLANGDVVSCVLTSYASCATSNTATSNLLKMTAVPVATTPTITITGSKNPICKGDNVLFFPLVQNSNNAFNYVWSVNGSDVSTEDQYATATLSNDDIVNCKLIGKSGCINDAISNNIIMTVYPSPTVKFDPASVVIAFGSSYKLNPIITGDIASYTWSPSAALSNPATPYPTTSTSTDQVYTLQVNTAGNCNASANVKIVVYRDLIMPSAFSPNGDNKNDIFRINPKYNSITVRSFHVYNRFGQIVFSTTDPTKGWDGTFNGTPQSAGTYIWLIEYLNALTGKWLSIKGSIVLIR